MVDRKKKNGLGEGIKEGDRKVEMGDGVEGRWNEGQDERGGGGRKGGK